MNRRERAANAVLTLFAGVLTAVLVYIFYVSNLRSRIEDKLFDIRTRLSPGLVSTAKVAVISIDDASIAALSPGTSDMTVDALGKVIDAALRTQAAAVVALLPGQVFPVTDPGYGDLVARTRTDERLVLGTFDVGRRPPNTVPDVFKGRGALGRVVRADVLRDFRREIIRRMVISETGELSYLPMYLARRFNRPAAALLEEGKQPDGTVVMELNYFNPRSLQQVRAEDLVRDPAGAGLAGKILLIGYTTYRPYTFYQQDATFINSPWSAEGDDLKSGLPVVTLQAIAAVNVVENAWLRTAPIYVNVIQTLTCAILSLVLWRLSVSFASLVFIGGWSLILLVHAGLFAFGRIHVPLTDTALWSSMATLAGALWRMRLEGRLRADQEAHLSTDRELAAVQDRFLNRFASELASLNTKLKTTLEALTPIRETSPTLSNAYVRALGSCEEFGDYLLGIQQFASMRERELARPLLSRVEVGDVIQTVLRQFDSRRQEARLDITVGGELGGLAHADGPLVAQILYNLVSNAVKYAPAGSVVTITVDGNRTQVIIRVKDQGPGIAPEFQERIFEKFYRVKDDYVYKLKGHGLGLYLSRYFASLIGASLSVASEPGHGAEFSLTLKRHQVR